MKRVRRTGVREGRCPVRITLDPEYWDRVADNAIPVHPLMAAYKRHEHVTLIRKWLGMQGKIVLKTDCYEEANGDDGFLDWLAGQSRRAIGVDISPRIARKARGRFPTVSFTAGDVRTLPFKDASLDAIVSNSTLDHFPTSDLITSLHEFHRVLKQGGMMVLTLDNKDNPMKFLFYNFANKAGLMPYHRERCYSLRETSQLARRAGFKVLDHAAIVHMFLPINTLRRVLPLRLHDLLTRALVPCFKVVAALPTRQFTGCFVAVLCEK